MTNMAASVPTTHKKFHIGKLISAIALYLAIAIVCVMTLFPIYWMLVSTFQPNEYTLRYPPPLFPKEIIFTQFNELFAHHPIALWLRNSLLIASMAMLISTALSVLGAYALSSLRWKGRSTFGLFLLVTQMLPEILVLIPLYVIYRQFNMLNSIPALSLVDTAFVLPICIWILKGVFDTVPAEVLDAAVVDGCTELSAIWNIVLPLSTPGLVAVAVVSFFSAWNEYLYASILLGNAKFMPASVGLSTLKAIASTPVEQYMAAGLVFSILPVLFYLSMQRYIVSGLTAGAVKG